MDGKGGEWTQILCVFEPLRDRFTFAEWKKELTNDFEEPVFRHHPQIAEIKDDMYAAGALFSSMSGSGSSVYGIFEKGAALPAFPADYFVKVV